MHPAVAGWYAESRACGRSGSCWWTAQGNPVSPIAEIGFTPWPAPRAYTRHPPTGWCHPEPVSLDGVPPPRRGWSSWQPHPDRAGLHARIRIMAQPHRMPIRQPPPSELSSEIETGKARPHMENLPPAQRLRHSVIALSLRRDPVAGRSETKTPQADSRSVCLLLVEVDHRAEHGTAVDHPFRTGAVGGVGGHEHHQLGDLFLRAEAGDWL